MIDWLRGGMLVQVTADSLTGHKGRRAQRMAYDLLDKRWVHFLATDAHNLLTRPPRMREAHDIVANKFGSGYAHSICVTNPLAVFMGREFEPLEEPQGIFSEVKAPGWWERVTSRLRSN
jgi:protein-tyrosine phosphatase